MKNLMRRVAIAGALAGGLALGVAAPALAVEAPPAAVQVYAAPAPTVVADDPAPAPAGETLVDVIVSAITGSTSLTWVDVLQLVVIPLLPWLVGQVNRLTKWPSLVKFAALGVLAIASQVLPDAVQAASSGTAFDWLRAILSAGVAWWLAQKSFERFYKLPINNGGKASASDDPPAPTTLADKIAGDV